MSKCSQILFVNVAEDLTFPASLKGLFLEHRSTTVLFTKLTKYFPNRSPNPNPCRGGSRVFERGRGVAIFNFY